MGIDIPVDYSFQSYQISTTLRADIPLATRATKNLEDAMLSVNYQSWRRSFLELPILSTVGVDIPVDRSFQSYQIPYNFKRWRSCSYQSYQKPGRHYASRQLSELTM